VEKGDSEKQQRKDTLYFACVVYQWCNTRSLTALDLCDFALPGRIRCLKNIPDSCMRPRGPGTKIEVEALEALAADPCAAVSRHGCALYVSAHCPSSWHVEMLQNLKMSLKIIQCCVAGLIQGRDSLIVLQVNWVSEYKRDR
jgi:hypothetical protein